MEELFPIVYGERHKTLENLSTLNKRQADIVELKFFGGLSVEEIAEILDLAPVTVRRDWGVAKLWLRCALQ